MGRAYPAESRERVKELLQQGRSEEEIEKETAVSDRTIRRWKLELERFGRIGKPPESRTGRHRVMGPDVEQALFSHVASVPEMTVDDMLWWLYDRYKLVVGTRTIRRAFERRNTSHRKFRTNAQKDLLSSHALPPSADNAQEALDALDAHDAQSPPRLPIHEPTYQSPYAPLAPMGASAADISPDLARALGGLAHGQDNDIHPALMSDDAQVSEDEETLELQLQQIALQKREIELKLKMRRLQRGRNTSITPRLSTDRDTTFLTDLDLALTHEAEDDGSGSPTTPGSKPRDSRAKNKIEEAKKRTEERQEKMLKELEKRSRRRDFLTAEWVQSKDVWPERAQTALADLMHRHGTYAYNQNSLDAFEAMFRELYQLVDHDAWYAPVHDDLLRERTRRKMAQLRGKMVKSGEIVGRGEGYGGWARVHGGGGGGGGGGGAPVEPLPVLLGGHELHALPDLPLDMDLHVAGHGVGDGFVDSSAFPPPPDALAQDLHAQALLGHQELQHEFDDAQQRRVASQHELLAQQGIAQQEVMAELGG